MPEAIKIKWGGKTYRIRANQTFELGEQIEDIISLGELSSFAEKPNFRRIARVYALMVNFAGGDVEPQEIHSQMMKEMKAGDEVQIVTITTALNLLVTILMDGAPEADAEESDEAKSEGKKKSS